MFNQKLENVLKSFFSENFAAAAPFLEKNWPQQTPDLGQSGRFPLRESLYEASQPSSWTRPHTRLEKRTFSRNVHFEYEPIFEWRNVFVF